MPEVPVGSIDLRNITEELHTVDLTEDLIVLQVAQAVQKQLKLMEDTIRKYGLRWADHVCRTKGTG